MSKTYIKVSGAWREVKKIYHKHNGAWVSSAKGFTKVSSTWRQIFQEAIPYTFTSSITATATAGIPLRNYIDPASADEFIITINSGVTLRGKTGTTGGAGTVGSSTTISNCHDSGSGNGGNGGAGATGGYAIDFTGFSGKKITFVNNGVIVGGTGGNGGNGGSLSTSCGYGTTYSGCGGAGGAGGAWAYATSGVTLVSGGSISSGGAGAAGAHGTPTSYSTSTCNCRSGNDCFLPGQKVLMADGTYRNVEDIKVGDKVQGGYGPDDINTVEYLEITRTYKHIYDINGLKTTPNHAILNKDRDGFVFASLEAHLEEASSYQNVINRDGETERIFFDGCSEDTKKESLHVGMEVAYGNETTKVSYVEPYAGPGEMVYNLALAGGSRTFCVEGYYVSGFIDDSKFNYKTGERK